ncbi:MAG: response regulator transcription factor [Bacteroidia bacterium]|jgi:DNA-binding response OmpR family regulator|nr:response regulator transcription factor [Bacteroidia bacterium]
MELTNRTKILLIEDEPKVLAFIKEGLEEDDYEVSTAVDGREGLSMATQFQYDVIVLDLMLPFISGIDVCKQVRALGIETPMLMLTALGTITDKVTGLDSGADDYLVKPFEFVELLARLRALTKRSSNTKVFVNIEKLDISDLVMDLNTKIVERAGKKIDLTAKEFLLLEYFLRNKGRVISRSEIAEKVWGINFDTGTNVIDVYINFLRKKIDKEHKIKLLHTIIGMGYTIRVENS